MPLQPLTSFTAICGITFFVLPMDSNSWFMNCVRPLQQRGGGQPQGTGWWCYQKYYQCCTDVLIAGKLKCVCLLTCRSQGMLLLPGEWTAQQVQRERLCDHEQGLAGCAAR